MKKRMLLAALASLLLGGSAWAHGNDRTLVSGQRFIELEARNHTRMPMAKRTPTLIGSARSGFNRILVQPPIRIVHNPRGRAPNLGGGQGGGAPGMPLAPPARAR